MGSLRSYIGGFDARLGQLNTTAPKVSIIVTNYNYSAYISDCLESVSRQTYPEIQCVIVDDRSSDDSVSKIKRFIENDKSSVTFKLVIHDAKRGQYAGFRTGIDHVTGAFISFLDADDFLLPDFVSEHVRVHLTLPPVAFTSSNQYQIDSSGQVIGGLHPDLLTESTYCVIGTISLQRPFWVWATTSSMMFRRSVLEYVLSDADETFRKCADNYVCHFSNLLGGSILVPTALGCYRRHQLNTFSNNPLIGGRLPTGDMRHHPIHEFVLHSIRKRMFDWSDQFISLLGVPGFLQSLSKVTPLGSLWRDGLGARKIAGLSHAKFYQALVWLYSRKIVRTLKNRHPGYTCADLVGAKRGAKIASYNDYQHHRRDAK